MVSTLTFVYGVKVSGVDYLNYVTGTIYKFDPYEDQYDQVLDKCNENLIDITGLIKIKITKDGTFETKTKNLTFSEQDRAKNPSTLSIFLDPSLQSSDEDEEPLGYVILGRHLFTVQTTGFLEPYDLNCSEYLKIQDEVNETLNSFSELEISKLIETPRHWILKKALHWMM